MLIARGKKQQNATQEGQEGEEREALVMDQQDAVQVRLHVHVLQQAASCVALRGMS